MTKSALSWLYIWTQVVKSLARALGDVVKILRHFTVVVFFSTLSPSLSVSGLIGKKKTGERERRIKWMAKSWGDSSLCLSVSSITFSRTWHHGKEVRRGEERRGEERRGEGLRRSEVGRGCISLSVVPSFRRESRGIHHSKNTCLYHWNSSSDPCDASGI